MWLSRLAFIAAGSGAAVSALSTWSEADAAGAGATILALYKKPADPAAFDSYYKNTHAPLAKKLPGLQSYTVSDKLAATAPYYMVAILTFESMDALQASLASDQGKAVVADLKNFAQAGVDIMPFNNVPV